MTSKRIFLLKQLLWFLCQLYKIIKITLIFFVSLLYDCSDLLWFVSETLKHSLIFVETLTENQFRSIPYLDSSCELSNVFFTLGGIHQLRGPKFDHLPQVIVDILHTGDPRLVRIHLVRSPK